MKEIIIIDSSALVAVINKRDDFHNWAVQTIANLAYPFLTCEPVITEACFLLQDVYNGEDAVMGLVSNDKLRLPFHVSEEASAVRELMRRYQSVPMSLADACLVRMAELYSGSNLLTIDSDFRIYRKNRNQEIKVIMPESL
jgi:predicted nucleic acid-binding protein